MVDTFIDYDSVRAQVNPDAMVGAVRYRVRPKDTGCLHPRPRYGGEVDGKVDVSCACGWSCKQVKVVDPHFSDRAACYLAELDALEQEGRR